MSATLEVSRVFVIARAVICNRTGRILVLHRSTVPRSRPLTWDLPGGRVEFGENPYETVEREVKEEAGIDITDLRVLDITSNVTPHHFHGIGIAFSAQYDNVQPIVLSFEHDDYKWVTFEEFQTLDTPEKYRLLVEKHKMTLLKINV
jgi:8-oxo-dGTP diphosphatase